MPHTLGLNIWNWKASLMSVLYRAPIFFFSSLRAGWRLALSAVFVETLFRASVSGFYGAVTQSLRKLEPAWLAIVLILVLAPAVVQTLEYAVHLARGTPNLRTGILVSTTLTAIASLFNWYAMRHGVMLTGKESQPFLTDVKKFPKILYGFLAVVPLSLMRRMRRR